MGKAGYYYSFFIRGILTQATLGLSQSISYVFYGIGLWYGVKMIKEEEKEPDFIQCQADCYVTFGDDVEKILECVESCRYYSVGSITVALFGVMMGGLQIGMSSQFLEATNTARAAAYAIYEIIKRK